MFTQRQITRILPQAVDALVQGDPEDARAWAHELRLSPAQRGHDIRAGDICSETLRLLNSEAKEGRQHARELLTDMLLDPVNIDASGEMISDLVKTWREDLVASLQAIEGVEEVATRGSLIEMTPANNQRQQAQSHLQRVLENELEHADWLVTLITSRAALYRADLEEIVVALSDFCNQRSDCSLVLTGHPTELRTRIGPLKLSIIQEDEFLVEILNAIEDHLDSLSREDLPEPLIDLVEQHILYPSEAPAYFERLASLVLETESLRSTYPESATLSKEELTAEIKSRAERLMRIIERESHVLYERATYKPQRCASLARISSYFSSTETQLAKMLAQTSEQLSFFISDKDTHRAHLERFRDQLYDIGGTGVSTWRLHQPHVFTLFIAGDDTLTGEDLLLIFKVCLAEYEEPDQLEDFEPDLCKDEFDRDQFEALSAEDTEQQIDVGELAGTHGLVSEGDENDEPLEFTVTALRPQGGELLSEGEQLAIWFSRLHSACVPLASNTPYHHHDRQSDWNYYGLSQVRCDKLFRPLFNLIEARYPHAWKLLPHESREALSLMDISDMSPLRQVLDLLGMFEEHYPDVTQFTPSQRQAVRAWIQSYRAWCDAPTMDILFSIPLWTRASKLFRSDQRTDWEVSQREDLLDDHDAFSSPSFFRPELHLLLHATTERGMNTLIELLEDGLVFLDGVSEAFVACLNTIPSDEIKKRIHHRAAPTLKLGGISSFWKPIPEETSRASLLALRTHFGTIWVDIHRSYKRGLL